MPIRAWIRRSHKLGNCQPLMRSWLHLWVCLMVQLPRKTAGIFLVSGNVPLTLTQFPLHKCKSAAGFWSACLICVEIKGGASLTHVKMHVCGIPLHDVRLLMKVTLVLSGFFIIWNFVWLLVLMCMIWLAVSHSNLHTMWHETCCNHCSEKIWWQN